MLPTLAITTLAFDVADPVLDLTTPLSAIGVGGVHFISVEDGYDLRAELKDGTVVRVSFEGAGRIEDLAAILEANYADPLGGGKQQRDILRFMPSEGRTVRYDGLVANRQ